MERKSQLIPVGGLPPKSGSISADGDRGMLQTKPEDRGSRPEAQRLSFKDRAMAWVRTGVLA